MNVLVLAPTKTDRPRATIYNWNTTFRGGHITEGRGHEA